MSYGLTNTKSVSDFVSYIRERLERSATALARDRRSVR